MKNLFKVLTVVSAVVITICTVLFKKNVSIIRALETNKQVIKETKMIKLVSESELFSCLNDVESYICFSAVKDLSEPTINYNNKVSLKDYHVLALICLHKMLLGSL